ncbi:MAG: M48 family metalloprotease [Capsulimonadales bacterium]|nr:M48 family metalloprotease [Capsulimonadales bacterium]
MAFSPKNGFRYGAAGLAVAFVAVSVPAVPAVAWQLFKRPSPEEQKRLGDQEAAKILKKYKEVTDGRAAHFKEVGRRLVAALPEKERNRWDFRFHVLESDEINAFALPGGEMFLFTGLYKRMKTEDEVAAVTGHEMSHVRQEHWAKAYTKAQERQLGLTGLVLLLKGSREARLAANLSESILGTKFSRSEEDEADKDGFNNMVSAGYNPKGMLNLFATLQKAAGNGGDRITGDFLSEHPLTTTRIKRTEERIRSLGSGKSFGAEKPLNYEALAGASTGPRTASN